jgi:hypothetical protein
MLAGAPTIGVLPRFNAEAARHSPGAATLGLAPSDLESLRHAKKSSLRVLVDRLDGCPLESLGVAARTLSKLATSLLNEL